MAPVLVGSAGAVASAATTTITPAYAQATTAGHLVTCKLQAKGTSLGAVATTSTGWTVVVTSATALIGQVAIAYKANCGASETAPTFTCTGATQMFAQLTEWSGVATTAPADQHGANNGTSVPSTTATAGAVDAASGDLVLAAGGWSVGTVVATDTTSLTANNGGTITALANNDSTSTNCHYRFGYFITTGNSSADATTFTSASTRSVIDAAVASFKAGGAVSHPITVSATAATTATVTRQVGRTVSATIATTVGIARRVGRTVKATVTTAATVGLSRLFNRTVAATVNTAATVGLTRLFNRTVSATVGTSAALSRTVAHSVSATVATTVAVTRKVARTVSASVSTTAATLRRLAITVAATVGLSATVTFVKGLATRVLIEPLKALLASAGRTVAALAGTGRTSAESQTSRTTAQPASQGVNRVEIVQPGSTRSEKVN